ncbi:helicase [Bacillus cereus]|nr:helicase [Bacillus cereus]
MIFYEFGGTRMTITMRNACLNRERIINAVRMEIVGPSAINENAVPLKVIGNIELEKEAAYKKYYWINCGVKEEVLQYELPARRYSAGMLYPLNTPVAEIVMDDVIIESIDREQEVINRLKQKNYSAEEVSEEKAYMNNERLPSSLGLTCHISNETQNLKVIFNAGHYKSQSINIHGRGKRKWWLRESMVAEVNVDMKELKKSYVSSIKLIPKNLKGEHIQKLDLELNLQYREIKGNQLVTVTVTNRTKSLKKEGSQADELMTFQSEITLKIEGIGEFKSYPKYYQRNLPMTEDEANDELLYRNKINYAFGHGCSTSWNQRADIVKEVKTSFIPTYETTSMTPDVEIFEKGEWKKINIRMVDLANVKTFKEVKQLLHPLITGYADWIQKQYDELPLIDKSLRNVAKRNLLLCKDSLERMKRGLEHLENEKVRHAFILANQAILLQQVNGKKTRIPRVQDFEITYDILIGETVLTLDKLQNSSNSWRAFQIAFFLMSLDSIVNNDSIEREVVDLIWFPTGGGKTEAYLAVASFGMFYRRLVNPGDVGVDVIMRYTLRLLTADQFQRSARLICAMEYLRNETVFNLGEEPFSIGMWVGSSTSPNQHKVALEKLRGMKQGGKDSTFIVSKCPWCGSTLGKVKGAGKQSVVLGFKSKKNELVTYCPDKECHFHKEIPVYFVDESIYEKCPTFLIGTVDKFVQLAWNPKARTLFGIDEYGNQRVTPPNLIIQDELHLISGPLGTLAGLFETVIEELCTKIVNGKRIKPKIISATATIKEFETQARCLFGRTQARLFPSPGLEIDDSFFAKVAVDAENRLMPGREYVGIFTSNVGLMMSEVQVFSSILQEANRLPQDEKDPYWTLLAFYNSLRELGAGINLCTMDIPTYMRAIQSREGYPENRFIREPLELTSRMQSDEIAATIDHLKVELKDENKKNVLDVCLASNIIEVGVDIDRLSVMAIVGQPKTTAQYIQVSGRVGRRWAERPGVIFTLYSNRNSRDKSHFEHFNEYHQRLYAQVETTSVTPFSEESLSRGLSAVIIAFLRQRFGKKISREPDSTEYMNIFKTMEFQKFLRCLVERVTLIDEEQVPAFKKKFEDFHTLMCGNYFTTWKVEDEGQGMMFVSGDPIAQKNSPKSIGVINSLRSVDATSLGKISLDVTNRKEEEKVGLDWGDIF